MEHRGEAGVEARRRRPLHQRVRGPAVVACVARVTGARLVDDPHARDLRAHRSKTPATRSACSVTVVPAGTVTTGTQVSYELVPYACTRSTSAS